jgi:methionyl-tRNA formyltransferase
MNKYVLASSRNWFNKHPKSSAYLSLNIINISSPEQLNLEFLDQVKPRYIFFPHWNWKIDSNIFNKYECVMFHTAPLPYGRGGSPIQNLILRKFKTSPVCAIKVTEVLDGGPIYDSLEVDLNGTIGDIFMKISFCIESLIIKICNEKIIPINQIGNVYNFSRLSYSDNELKCDYSLDTIYDIIRMVDGEGYNNAFIKFGGYKLEFYNSELFDNEIRAHVRFFRNEN